MAASTVDGHPDGAQHGGYASTHRTGPDDQGGPAGGAVRGAVLPDSPSLPPDRARQILGHGEHGTQHELGDGLVQHSPGVGQHDVALDDLRQEDVVHGGAAHMRPSQAGGLRPGATQVPRREVPDQQGFASDQLVREVPVLHVADLGLAGLDELTEVGRSSTGQHCQASGAHRTSELGDVSLSTC